MLSALIQTAQGSEDPEPEAQRPAKRRQLKLDKSFRPVKGKELTRPSKGPSATLVVAPTSLLSQWSEELERSSKPGTLKVLVWHGQGRLDIEAAIEGEDAVDVVVTSYGTLVSEHAKSEKQSSPIFEGSSKVTSCLRIPY